MNTDKYGLSVFTCLAFSHKCRLARHSGLRAALDLIPLPSEGEDTGEGGTRG